jgi:hypothetical protein
MFNWLRSLLGITNASTEAEPAANNVDCQQIVGNIRSKERSEIPVGRKIYDLSFKEFEILLDREFTGHYRISVFQNQHKIYGFTVSEKEISDDEFVVVWEIIIDFLSNNPSPKQLPDHDLMNSHFFGSTNSF